MDTNSVSLALLLRRFRRQAGLTQTDLAELSGISVAGVRDLEQGRVGSPRTATLRRLAVALDLSTVDLEMLERASARRGLTISVLGTLHVALDGQTVELGSTAQRTVLGLLAVCVNNSVSRDVLVEAIWGVSPPRNAAELLHTHISRLRRKLRPSGPVVSSVLMRSTSGGYMLAATAAQLDVVEFQDAVTQARHAHERGDLDGECASWECAMRCWRGDALMDLPALHSHPAVVALARQWLEGVLAYAQVAARLGRSEQVLPLLQRAAAAEPLHEGIHAQLMLALAGTGQQAAALRLFEQFRRSLDDELGTSPGLELMAAHERVLRQEFSFELSPPAAAWRQLPPDIADFTGREAELGVLHGQIADAYESSETAVMISAIEGMAGVGKTRLAIHLAHKLTAEGRYRDVQLYVDLHGYADQPATDPSSVLASFLYLLGIPGNEIPADVDARVALYRAQLRDKHALVVLDNAADKSQVAPLMPESRRSLVLITSRRAIALDGAVNVALDVFTLAEAHELLRRIIGRDRVDANLGATNELIDLCGSLPLALALAARRLQTRPVWQIADLVRRIKESGDRLDELTAGSRGLRAVFDLSYRGLSPDLAATFRLIACHPGDDLSSFTAAALIDQSPVTAQRLLNSLVDEHLLSMASATRYRLHDLLHRYASRLAELHHSDAERREAVTRLLDYYLHTAVNADELIMKPVREMLALVGETPTHRLRFSTVDDAKRWLDAERSNMVAAINDAAEHGWHGHAWRLALALRSLLHIHGYTADWLTVYQTALHAASRDFDQLGEAVVRMYIGAIQVHSGKSQQALQYLRPALEYHETTGDRLRQSSVLSWLGLAYQRLSRFDEALRCYQRAALLCEGVNAYREGVMHTSVADVLTILGRLDEATERCQRGLQLSREAGDRENESITLTNLGNICRRLGLHRDAHEYLEEALRIAAEERLPPVEGKARYRLGQVYRAQGDLDEALTQLNAALQLVRRVCGEATECEVLVDLSALHLDQDDVSAARNIARKAVILAIETRDRYQEARALECLAAVEQRLGLAEIADLHGEQARVLFANLRVPRKVAAGASTPDPRV